MLPANLKPMVERVLFEIEVDKETVLSSGLIVVSTIHKDDITAKIIAAGPGRLNKDDEIVPMELRVGDTILCPKKEVQEVTMNGKKYGIIKESDVYGVITEEWQPEANTFYSGQFSIAEEE
jgi:chaperonin GroES